MSTAPRILFKSVLWVLGAIIILVLAVFAINAFDQDIRPETTALLQSTDNPYIPADNLYIALVGFDAPEGQSVVTVGEARVAENEFQAARVLKDPQLLGEWRERSREQQKTIFIGKTEFCRPVTGSCWTGIESHQLEINSLLKDNQELYRRYLALHALRGYFETEAPSYLMTFAYVPGEMRALFLANTALRIKTGTTAQARNAALVDLGNDVGTWQRMLVGNGGLVSKMLAVVSLHGDYVLLGDMIADPRIDLAPLSAEIDKILTQVTSEDWKLHNVFANEFRISAPFFEHLRRAKSDVFGSGFSPNDEKPEWWESSWAQIQAYFLKVNATQNISARGMMEVQKMAEADPHELLTAQQVLRSWSESNLGFGPSFVYNPMGKTLVTIGMSAYDEYPLRVYDVAAYPRAVRLAYEIRKQQLPASAISAFSSQHREWATHPVSGEPLAWDPQAREMRIQPMGKSAADRRFNIPVWTGPAT